MGDVVACSPLDGAAQRTALEKVMNDFQSRIHNAMKKAVPPQGTSFEIARDEMVRDVDDSIRHVAGSALATLCADTSNANSARSQGIKYVDAFTPSLRKD